MEPNRYHGQEVRGFVPGLGPVRAWAALVPRETEALLRSSYRALRITTAVEDPVFTVGATLLLFSTWLVPAPVDKVAFYVPAGAKIQPPPDPELVTVDLAVARVAWHGHRGAELDIGLDLVTIFDRRAA